jgi:hypothetical protein
MINQYCMNNECHYWWLRINSYLYFGGFVYICDFDYQLQKSICEN